MIFSATVIACREWFQTVPYDMDNTVNMIWHNYKLIQPAIHIMVWQIQPTMLRSHTVFAQRHTTIDNFPKPAFYALHTDCYKICSRCLIIETQQALFFFLS